MATRINSDLVSNSPGTPSPSPAGGLQPAAVATNSGGSTKVSGTDGNDVFTLTDAQKSDFVIKTGLGDDVFRFNGSEGARNAGHVNGVVNFGGAAPGQADNDQVVLGYQISDYEFTLRSGEGIKIKYVGSDENHHIDGAAVTFYGADLFTFRNASDTPGEPSFKSQSYTYDQLKALIIDSGMLVA